MPLDQGEDAIALTLDRALHFLFIDRLAAEARFIPADGLNPQLRQDLHDLARAHVAVSVQARTLAGDGHHARRQDASHRALEAFHPPRPADDLRLEELEGRVTLAALLPQPHLCSQPLPGRLPPEHAVP